MTHPTRRLKATKGRTRTATCKGTLSSLGGALLLGSSFSLVFSTSDNWDREISEFFLELSPFKTLSEANEKRRISALLLAVPVKGLFIGVDAFVGMLAARADEDVRSRSISSWTLRKEIFDMLNNRLTNVTHHLFGDYKVSVRTPLIGSIHAAPNKSVLLL